MAWLTGWLKRSPPAPRDAGDEAVARGQAKLRPHRMRKAKSYRRFEDAAGVVWHVWEVDPREAERRRLMRRAANEAPKAGQLSHERRRRESRVAIRPGYENGWLAFASAGGAKRLAPVPPGWTALSDSALDELRRRAVHAEHPRHRPVKKRPQGAMPTAQSPQPRWPANHLRDGASA